MSKTERITSLLQPAHINLNITATDKEPALREIAGFLANHDAVKDFEVFFSEVLQREKVSNTALGHAVAIPHARTDQCRQIVFAIGRSSDGIAFEAKDDLPVHLVFLIGTPKAMVADYLRIVGHLARLLRRDDLREALLQAETPESFIQLLSEAGG